MKLQQVLLWKIYGNHTKRIILTLLIFHGIALWNQSEHYMEQYAEKEFEDE